MPNLPNRNVRNNSTKGSPGIVIVMERRLKKVLKRIKINNCSPKVVESKSKMHLVNLNLVYFTYPPNTYEF